MLEMFDTPCYETPVFPEVDVIEPAVRGIVPELVSDSESDHSQSSAEDHADLFETLQESLISYRAAEKELLRRRNQYRDIQNEAAEHQRQVLKEKEVRKLLGKSRIVLTNTGYSNRKNMYDFDHMFCQ